MSDYDDDDDDLEIINVTNSESSITTVDVDDLKFFLRNDEKRLRELFPHSADGSSSVVYRLDEKELQVASTIINREKLQLPSNKAIANQPPRPTCLSQNTLQSRAVTGQKRKESGETSTAATPSSIFSLPKKVNPLLSSPGNTPTLKKRNEGTISIPLHFATTSTIWKGQENMKFIGSSLVDMNALLNNSSQINQSSVAFRSSKEKDKEKELIARKKRKEEETALFSQIDKLLNQKSSHEEEANVEWHSQFNKRLISLEKQEFKSNKKTQLSSIKIQAFECHDCNHFITEAYPALCKEKKHTIHQITTIKRFFYCSSCNRRDYTLTNESLSSASSSSTSKLLFLPPSRNCVSCGKDNWRIVPAASVNDKKGNTVDEREKGKQLTSSSSSSMHSLLGEKLVTSASEWTSRGDRLNMATRVSNLDK
jgi:hypothetical protein